MAFFKKLFGGKEKQFQEQVLATVRKHHPSLQTDSGAGSLSVRVNGVDLDLQKLFAVCEQNQTQADEFILQYFSCPAALCMRAERVVREEAEARVRPQLVPSHFAERFGVLMFPVVADIVAGLVLRGGSGTPFLRAGDVDAWGITPDALYRKSLENLDADPMEMEVTITDGADRFIGMETHDGYDAARILLPRVREFAAGKIAMPYFAGIPNRDFLILWSQQCSPRFQDYALEKIETDFAIQPFPLTSARFVVDAAGIHLL